jgi:transposase InsO family protein
MSFLYALLTSWYFLRCRMKSLVVRRLPRRRHFRRRLVTPTLSRRRKPLWVVEAVLRIRACCPHYGYGRVAVTFNRCHVTHGFSVSRFFVAYTIRHHQCEIACLRRNFCRALRWMGIHQRFTKPGRPWMNGRIERLFGTLKKVLKSISFQDEQALTLVLARFCFAYNTLRPHSALNGRTPDEAWHGINPYGTPFRNPVFIHPGRDEMSGVCWRR